jgi:hypothetical protein
MLKGDELGFPDHGITGRSACSIATGPAASALTGPAPHRLGNPSL